MPAPVRDGHVTQDYGVPGNYAAGYHTGRDWAGGTTRDIVATRAGKVTRVAYGDGDYGNRVEILTGDIEHSYSHMATIAVAPGQEVAQGAYLGEMGETGNSAGIHCHYEERAWPYGYNDCRSPEFDVTDGEPAPQPIEDEDVKPYVVNDGASIWLTDLATYKTGIKDYRVADDGLNMGVYQSFNAGLVVSNIWKEHISRLPTVA